MKKIEYRGRKTLSKEWVFGGIVPNVYGGVPLIMTDTRKTDSCDIEWEFEEVSPETVGQYTGLRDKNGRRIFEGDIVVYDNSPYNEYCVPYTGEIVWHKWAWRFKYKEYGSVYYYSLGAEDFFGAKSEVIGNIHDNPKLLEG